MNEELWCPTENDIINAVVSKLESLNFNIINTCNTKEHGTDIIAEKGQFTLLIEAKGATSSIEKSKRNGKPFNRNQARTHVSVAIFTALSLASQHKDKNNFLIGIALPYEKNHREFILRVKYALDIIGIVMFWVKNEEVIIEVPCSYKEHLFT